MSGMHERSMLRDSKGKHIAGTIVSLAEERLPERLVQKLNTNQDLFFDTTRIRQELGYRELVSLDEALTHTIAWQRANPPADLDPHLFDYTLEDGVLAEITKAI